MAKSYEVDLAVAEMLTRVIPDYRFVTLEDDSADRPRRIDPHGTVWLRDGEPGEPDIDLSPPTYHYNHVVPVEIAAYLSSEPLRLVLDRMAGKIGAAVAADRSLGGLVSYLDVTALELVNINVTGGQTQKGGMFNIIATYSTHNPL
ncbi:hypothetical protein [Sphingobium yanoikuyae]|uniref:hypothetical protein n=1 Tax=Sphingobium yanoikuyae TaxID=13690 RepID=UPI001378ED5E|nr:hypothetical protein [Sphingobium yanoikuyae]NBB37645.1 hypothetical protein [Sphingobium yanoikuyae]